MFVIPSSWPRLRRVTLALTIGSLLFLTYLLTFTGFPLTNDERFIIDTTDSMAVRANWLLNETGYLRPFQTTDVEPAQPVLSIPLYWLAYHTPWVGNVHALYLFTPLVTALTAIFLFLFAIDLGYSDSTALIAALLFGLTTIVWPYAQTYFREPLTTLSIFVAAYLWNRWRKAFTGGERHHWWVLGLAALTTLLALSSKEAALIALPALALYAYPGGGLARRSRRQVVAVLIGVAGIAVVAVLAIFVARNQLNMLATRYNVYERIGQLVQGLPGAGTGLAGYLVSPGKGIWWYSPILFLALGAPFVLPRDRWRESWLPLGLTLLFATVYAAERGVLWHGGAGWGARYMVPLVPFLMLATLPLLDRILHATTLWPKLGLAALTVYGFAVQIGGTYVGLYSFYAIQGDATGQPPWVGPAIWSFRWSQALGSVLAIPTAQTNIVWWVRGIDWLSIGVIALLLVALIVVLVWLIRRDEAPPLPAALVGLIPLVAVAAAIFALWRAYDDPRFRGGDTSLDAARAYLVQQTGPEDIILLSSPTYVPYFMNYYKGQATWFSLALSPGEIYSPDEAPAVTGEPVERLVGKDNRYAISIFTFSQTFYTGRPIWLVEDQGPWLPWATRPVEWYMAKHLYPVATQDFDQYARVITYLPLIAPDVSDEPANPVGVRLGGSIQLVGYDLVANERDREVTDLHPGDTLGVSLLWEALGPINSDYTVAVFLIGPDGVPVLQQDWPPVEGFAPTSSWQPGARIRDNHGFRLPTDLPPGQYQLWVLAYSWPSLERLPVTGPDGEALGDYVTLATIEVR